MYNKKEVVQAISKGLDEFYTHLIASLDTINIQKIMKRKNPYLYRAKATNSAVEIVDSILSAYVSSSEETIFGNCFFEPLAIAASGGNKALAEGVDIMIQDKKSNLITAVAVKSGTSVYNADSKKRQAQNFMAAAKLAQQAKARYLAVIGYGYGQKGKPSNKAKPQIYKEIAGQDFWYFITDDKDFYTKIINFMGKLPEHYIGHFNIAYDKARNRLLREFTIAFCDDSGQINWEKLLKFNSGSKIK